MEDIMLVGEEILQMLTKIFNLYTTNILLSAVFAIWFLNRVARLFDRLK